MARFFVDGLLTERMTIYGADAHHASHVLRLRPGDEIWLIGHRRMAGRFEIETITPTQVIAKLCEQVEIDSEPSLKVYLAQSLTKGDKMDYIVQKAVELGASTIIPLLAQHSVVRYDQAKQTARRQRWQKIAAEAAKQCGRLRIPEVADCQSLAELFSNLSEKTVVIMLYEAEQEGSLRQRLKNSLPPEEVVLLIGPEGGFSSEEVAFCRENGAHTVSVGPRILRTETAATAALAMVMYEWGDLGG